MSETDPGKPRRAVEPSDDTTGPDAAGGAEQPTRAWAPTEAAKGTDAAPDQPDVTTPIPPPAPALPEPTQPAASGRRFSAEDLAEDWVSPAPRRSAVSVSSPPFSPIEPDADVATDADAPTAEVGAVSEAGTATAPGVRRRTAMWLIGGIAAALVIGLVAWLGTRGSGTTAAPPGPASPSPSESVPASAVPVLADAQLIAPAELAKLIKKTTWAVPEPAASTDVPRQPACIELSTTGGASPDGELNRLLTANKGGGTLLQFVQSWPDVNAAGIAFNAFVTQAGACDDALVSGANRITGLADAATVIGVQLADGSSHTLLLTRTGRFVSLVDAALPSGSKVRLPASAVVAGSAPSQARQCGPASGACPAKPKTVPTAPPATETVGWLAWVDLPRVSAGAGTWTATDPQAPKLVGSQCEDVDLNKLPGTTSAAHRTYLLTDDPKAPEGFGIDEAIYTFAKASDATAAAKKLNGNFADCGERTRTASVKDAKVTAPDASGKELKSTSYLVTQRISDSKTVTFRVGVATAGNRLVYLMANPATNFDFSDAAWRQIVGRANQRATQFA